MITAQFLPLLVKLKLVLLVVWWFQKMSMASWFTRFKPFDHPSVSWSPTMRSSEITKKIHEKSHSIPPRIPWKSWKSHSIPLKSHENHVNPIPFHQESMKAPLSLVKCPPNFRHTTTHNDDTTTRLLRPGRVKPMAPLSPARSPKNGNATWSDFEGSATGGMWSSWSPKLGRNQHIHHKLWFNWIQ